MDRDSSALPSATAAEDNAFGMTIQRLHVLKHLFALFGVMLYIGFVLGQGDR